MSSFRIATRYSKSLLQLAQEKGVLDAVYADMKGIDSIFENSKDLRLLFKSPIITTDKKLTIVKKLFEGKITGLLYQFMVLLIKKGRESHLHEITESFITQYNAMNGI